MKPHMPAQRGGRMDICDPRGYTLSPGEDVTCGLLHRVNQGTLPPSPRRTRTFCIYDSHRLATIVQKLHKGKEDHLPTSTTECTIKHS